MIWSPHFLFSINSSFPHNKFYFLNIKNILIAKASCKHSDGWIWGNDARCFRENVQLAAIYHLSHSHIILWIRIFWRRLPLSLFVFSFLIYSFVGNQVSLSRCLNSHYFSRLTHESRESQQRRTFLSPPRVINVKIYCSCLMLTTRISGTKSKCEKLKFFSSFIDGLEILPRQFITLISARGEDFLINCNCLRFVHHLRLFLFKY